jgi:hypothetical protein
MPKSPKTVAELYEAHESFREQAKALYEKADSTLKKLVRTWKKNKSARIDLTHVLEIDDAFRGQVKAFAPGFAHRYKLKLRTVSEE